jgi:hypothetical protein
VQTTHDPRLVSSRLQIHESKYESVARFRIQAPWKRALNLFWQVIRTLKIHFGIVQFHNSSRDKMLHLFDVNQFEIQPHNVPLIITLAETVTCWILWSTKNIRVSDVIVSDILDSDHLPIIFHILDYVKIRNLSDHIEEFTDWDRFQSLPSELTSQKIEIISGVEADKAARNYKTSIASAYRLSTCMTTLLYLNNDLRGMHWLLRHTQRLRK